MQHLWGHSEVVYEETETALGFILVRATAVGGNGASSVHHHKHHQNQLLVLEGEMLLRLFDDSGEMETDSIAVEEGQTVFIEPGCNHQIVFPEPAELMEWYVPVMGHIATLDDIYRIAPGKQAVA